jgi:hypothetical protein
MPKHLRFKCAFQYHDLDPKNTACINPTFRHQTWQLGEDPLPADTLALTNELADKLAFLPGATTPFTVKCFDIEKPKPNPPLAVVTRNAASPPKVVTTIPEAAVVLSFFAANNRPRSRGRLYFPAWLLGASSGDMGREVPAGLRTALAAVVPYFESLGGGNVDWGVWSSVDHAFHKATDVWISYAWATMRSRGIKESNRQKFTTTG